MGGQGMELKSGDIVRYAGGGSFPEGQPIIIEALEADGLICKARSILTVTRFRIMLAHTQPFDDGMSIEDAVLEAIRPIKGNLAEIHLTQAFEAYDMLRQAGRIPEIDENRIVRASA